MGIIISGIDMPTNCTRCPCSDDGARFCRAANEYIPMLGKPNFCPLVEAEERKTGKWINNIHDIPICDQCGYMTPYDRAIDDYEYGNYCPNCGAKMEGEQQ